MNDQKPKRWVDHAEPKNATARAIKQLLLDVEEPTPSPSARARVALRLHADLTASGQKTRWPYLLIPTTAVLLLALLWRPESPAPAKTAAPTEHRLVLPNAGEVKLTGDTQLTLTRLQQELIAELSPGTAHFELAPMTPPNSLLVRAGRFSVRAHSGNFVVHFANGVATLKVTSGDAQLSYEESEEELYAKARDERDPAAAIALYDRVAAMNGSHAELAAHQAARKTMKLGRTQTAIARFEQLLAKFPGGLYAHEARLDLIECRIKNNDPAAKREIDLFLKQHPESERASELRRLRARLK